ncbi:GNAT family N-acetyltransferase [Myceligenerans pegani]|uniref:GNAT family N-acetyltransferase n=1 Tax=Myceligenerans pegani TaxID=2776917 RepID=UPI001CF05BB4|nr:GNAT family protein [Myceligenerans sp. TRM 65318]
MISREDLATVWPAFALTVRCDDLELRVPDDADLLALADVAAQGVYDRPDVPYRWAWTRGTPEEVRRNVLAYQWAARGHFTPDRWRLELGVFHDGDPVGIQAISARNFPVTREATTGSWLASRFQGRSIGKRMRLMALSLMFDGLAAAAMHTEADRENVASNAVSERLGYAPNGVGTRNRDGAPAEEIRYRMTAHAWATRPDALRPQITIDGLDAVRDQLGIHTTASGA